MTTPADVAEEEVEEAVEAERKRKWKKDMKSFLKPRSTQKSLAKPRPERAAKKVRHPGGM